MAASLLSQVKDGSSPAGPYWAIGQKGLIAEYSKKTQMAGPGPASSAESFLVLYLDPQNHKTGNLDLTSEVILLYWGKRFGPREIAIL